MIAPSTALSVEVRDVVPEEYDAYVALATRAFHGTRIPDTDVDRSWIARRYASQRVTAAFTDGRMVGTFRTWDGDLAVPGGVLTADFVSTVTVAPTHRRRGVLTRMMDHDLKQAKEAGTPLAYLIASSAQIYGRYGYGVCAEHGTWTVDADPTLFRLPPGADELTVELCDDAALEDVAPAVYDAAYRGMPGAKSRDDLWWRATLGLAGLTEEHPMGLRHAVIVRSPDGTPVAYARYKVNETVVQRVDASELQVHDLAASTAAGYARIWQFLASIDLVGTLKAGDRPVDEPLPWLLTDRRAARQSDRADFGWARLLDVPAALSGRRYSAPGRCVLEVLDPAGYAGGTFALEADESGAGQATPTVERPDVTLDVRTLGVVYLGQIPLVGPRVAGLVAEHTDGAAALLASMLFHPATNFVTHTWF